MKILATPRGICAIDLGLDSLLRPGGGKTATAGKTLAAAVQIRQYLKGRRKNLDFKIALERGTDFQRRVWRALRRIPYGETRSYAWVAAAVGRPKAVRAVGQACGANPLPLYFPCHRVVAANGGIGGFSGGLKWKRRLLELEKNSGR